MGVHGAVGLRGAPVTSVFMITELPASVVALVTGFHNHGAASLGGAPVTPTFRFTGLPASRVAW